MPKDHNKYYKTVVQVVILSDRPYDYKVLYDIADDISFGDCSGSVKTVSSIEVSQQEMADLLLAQGSDPAFLIEGY